MKKISFVILTMAVVVLAASCNFENNSQYTPQIAVSLPVRTCGHADTVVVRDTLGYRYDKDGKAVLDTIHVGDTVRVVVAISAQGNVLTGFQTTWDTAALQLEYLAMDSIAFALDTAKSDIAAGTLVFQPGYNMAVFPIRYIPRKSVTTDFTMEVQSDSKYSPNSFTIQQTAE
ncbi:MAG: hypothetical protein ACI4BD_02235 [Paludibacteraceae bacterium]